jgi:hypothetical protein
MRLFLVFLWYSAVAGRWGCLNLPRYGSRLGGFNSRLGRREFPFYSATGIGRQPFDLTYRFLRPNGGFVGKIDEIPVPTGKNGNFDPTDGNGPWHLRTSAQTQSDNSAADSRRIPKSRKYLVTPAKAGAHAKHGSRPPPGRREQNAAAGEPKVFSACGELS